MSFWGRSYFVFILTLALVACSNTPPAGEGSGNPDANSDATTESAADQVGSVPEDMLADEKAPEGGEAEAATAEPGTSPEGDPFSDLKAEEEKPAAATDSLAVAEENDASSDSSLSAGSGQIEKYKVKSGDTLMKIAFHLYGDVDRWKDILELNRSALKSGNALRKGMTLRYEAPLEPFQPDELAHSYQIKSGDTLANIADEVYGRKAKYKKLQGYNKSLIKNPNRIFAGFTIYYDITQQEVAEAEARRSERMATKNASPSFDSAPAPTASAPAPAPAPLPSAISPPTETAPPAPSASVAPSAIDSSTVPGPGAAPSAAPPATTTH